MKRITVLVVKMTTQIPLDVMAEEKVDDLL